MATMANSATDDAAAAGVAVPVESYGQYREALEEQSSKPGYATVGDHVDINRGWTAQSEYSHPIAEEVPGQLYSPAQLPDPGVAVLAGMPAVAVPPHLVTEDDDHPQGPEPWESGIAPNEVREGVRARVIREHSEARAARAAAKSKVSAAPAAPKSSAASGPGSVA